MVLRRGRHHRRSSNQSTTARTDLLAIALVQTTIILVILFLLVANKRAGNFGKRLHARGPLIIGVCETRLVGAITPVIVAGGCVHPLQLLEDRWVGGSPNLIRASFN